MKRKPSYEELQQRVAELEKALKKSRALQKAHADLEMPVKERSAELERRNQELQDFTYMASHDLQEPLRKIQMFSDHILKRCSASMDDTAIDYLNRMQDAGRRMQNLITALLDYSKVTTRPSTLALVDLNEVAQEAMQNVEYWLKQTKGQVKLEPLPLVAVDFSQMVQLFQNLLSNGLKYHKPDDVPVVRLYSSERTRNAFQIFVEDNGIGFDEKYLDQIFAPFERLHGRSSSYSGVGMGLAICRKIVERHGGTITAKSSLGNGSTFIVTLPRKNKVLIQGKEGRKKGISQSTG